MLPITQSPPLGAVHLRWCCDGDYPALLTIEAASFVEPWTEQDFRHFTSGRRNVLQVAEWGCQVVGYVGHELRADRLVVREMAVDPPWRRRGVGRQMLWALIGRLHAHRPLLTYTIRESSLEACFFLRACGLFATEVRRGWFAEPEEDGYRFEYRLEETVP